MKCNQCGQELNSTDTFCIKCGTKVAMDETAASVASFQDGNQRQEEAITTDLGKKTDSNEKVEKARQQVSQYWNFILENLKAPTVRGLEEKSNNHLFGYMNIFVFSLLFAFASYFQAKAATRGFSFFGSSVSFFETFFSVFFYSIVSLLLIVVLKFAVLKFLLKVKVTFNEIVSRYGSLMSVTVALSAIMFLIAIPGLSILLTFVSLLMFCGLLTAVVLTFFSYRNEAEASFDPIYALFLVFVGYALFIGITADLFMRIFIGGFFPF